MLSNMFEMMVSVEPRCTWPGFFCYSDTVLTHAFGFWVRAVDAHNHCVPHEDECGAG